MNIALELCDELGLLEELPEPVELERTSGVVETGVGDLLIRQSRWRQVHPEVTPWEHKTVVLMSSQLIITDGHEITRLVRELYAAWKFLKEKREDGE